MGARVAVAGASGYAGGELLRLLAGHPDLEIGPVTGQGNAGQPVGAVHPHLAALPGLAGRRFEALEESLLGECDLVFLALPHGQSAALAAGLPAGPMVVDLGADFRLGDPAAWQKFYGSRASGPVALRAARNCPAGAPRSAPPARSPRPAATPPRWPWPWPRCWRRAWSAPRTWSWWPRPARPARAGRPSRNCSAARSWARCPPTRSVACTGTPRRWSRPSARPPGRR